MFNIISLSGMINNVKGQLLSVRFAMLRCYVKKEAINEEDRIIDKGTARYTLGGNGTNIGTFPTAFNRIE